MYDVVELGFGGEWHGQTSHPLSSGGLTTSATSGIWATAPFLHNGSVPTVELVLNSAARPAAWRRVSQDSAVFDEDAMGWPFIEVQGRQEDAAPEDQKYIYDTGYWSQSNGGHTFGDHLAADERRAVIEYLKTL